MIRRATRHFVELIAASLAVATILLGAAAWFLAQGPVALTVFKPTVAETIARTLDVDAVDFSAAHVQWRPQSRSLELTITDARLFEGNDAPALQVPFLGVSIRAGALLRGRIRPTRISFSGASARFTRAEDGDVGLGFMASKKGPEPSNPEPSNPEPSNAQSDDRAVQPETQLAEMHLGRGGLLKLLIQPESDVPTLRALEAIEIRDARLEFVDSRSGMTFGATGAEVQLLRERRDDGAVLSLTLAAGLLVGDQVVDVSATGAPRADGAGFDITVRFDPIDPKAVQHLVPRLSVLAPLEFPIGGSVTLGHNALGVLETLTAQLVGGPGTITLPHTDSLPMVEREHMDRLLATMPDTVPIRSVALAFAYDVASGHVDLDRAAIRTDKADFAIAGDIDLTLDQRDGDQKDGSPRLRAVAVDLEGRNMTVYVPVYSAQPARLSRLRVAGAHDFDTGETRLETARLDAYGGFVEVSGRFGAVDGKPEVFLDGTLGRFPADKLESVWPRGLAVGAREWITTNVTAGRLGEGTLKLDAPAGTFDVGYIPNDAMRLDFTLEGMTMGFVPGLPPMTDLAGSATLFGDTFEARFDTARIGQIAVSEGRMLTEDLHIRGTFGVFDAVASGPLPDVLSLLDLGPFGYPSRYGVDPAKTGGRGGVRLHVALPLRRNLKIEQIEFSAAANVRDFAFDLSPEVQLSDGTVELKINGAGLSGTGDVSISGLPAHVQWTEDFTGASPLPTTISVKTILDDTTRARLGFDLGDMVSGPLNVTATAHGRGAQLQTLKASADLRATTLRLPGTAWTKPAGDAVVADLEARMGEGGEIIVDPFTVQGPYITVDGTLTLGADLRLLALDFPTLRIDELADLSTQSKRTGQDLELTIRGPYLNLDPLLDAFGSGMSGTGAEQKSAATPAPPQPNSASKVGITAQLDRIDLKRDVRLTDASARLMLKGMWLEDATLRSGIGASGTAHVTLSRKTEDGQSRYRDLIATATDAGALARGFLDTDAVAGGQIRLTALLTDPMEGRPGSGAIEGNLAVEDFRVVNAPLLARLLTAGSPTGLGDLLQGDGIRFTRLSLPFENRANRWTLHDGQAYGPSIGITVDGDLDEHMQATDLRGTIVPAYGVNSVLGKVPLIGDVLINKDGEGLFAFTYRIVGSEDGSSIYVNPLSGLAPGFLRRLFQLGGDRN